MNQPPATPVRSPSPVQSFLASLRRRIESHFNPDLIMQNDIRQAILTCYQGCYPLQLVLANPFFQDYVAHCTEMGLPVVPTFLRAIEHSRLISVTDDQLFIYLVVVPQLQQPCPTNYFEAAALGPMMQQQPTVYGPSCESTRDNVQELASINGNPQMIQHAQNWYNQPAHSSGSPTSVFEAYHDAQQQPIVTMMIGNNVADCTEMGLPVVPTFLRAIEDSRLISVTDDQPVIYLACPTNCFEAAALGPMMQQPRTVYGPSCESTRAYDILVAELIDQVSKLQDSLRTANELKGELQDRVDGLQGRVDGLERQRQELEQVVSNLRDEVEAKQSDLDIYHKRLPDTRGEKLRGKRCQVLFDMKGSTEQRLFSGVIQAFSLDYKKGKHYYYYIVFDDGQKKWIELRGGGYLILDKDEGEDDKPDDDDDKPDDGDDMPDDDDKRKSKNDRDKNRGDDDDEEEEEEDHEDDDHEDDDYEDDDYEDDDYEDDDYEDDDHDDDDREDDDHDKPDYKPEKEEKDRDGGDGDDKQDKEQNTRSNKGGSKNRVRRMKRL